MDRRSSLPLLAVLALVTVGVAGCLDDFGTVEAPEWKTGYSFAYAGTSSYQVDAVQKENGQVVDEAHEEEEDEPFDYFLEVLDDDYDAAGQPVYLSALTVPAVTEALLEGGFEGPAAFPVGVRHRDLAMVYPSTQYQQQCLNDDCESRMDFQFSEPQEDYTYLDFPLTKGDVWSYTEEGADLDVTIRFEAEGAQSVETPAGTYEAVRIAVDLHIDGLDELIADAHAEAAEEGIQVDALELDMDADATIWYSPGLGAVVKTASAYHEYTHVRFQQDGDTYETTVRIAAEGQEVLTGARPVQGPERSATNIMQVFVGGERLIDPTGEAAPVDGAYDLHLSADRYQLNAAEAETVAFTATPTQTLPGGHSLRIELRGPEGDVVATGTGASLEHRFDDPGVFIAHADAYDADGARQASDAVAVVADYRATVPVDCAPVSTGAVQALACDAVPLPVRNGIRSLEVRAVPSDTTVLPELVVTDPMGGETTGDDGVRIEDFSGYTVDGRDWTARWQPGAAVLEQGHLEIHLAHGGAIGGQEAAGALPVGAGVAVHGLPGILDQGFLGGLPGDRGAETSALHIVTKDLN